VNNISLAPRAQAINLSSFYHASVSLPCIKK